jgi:hypothetical protein
MEIHNLFSPTNIIRLMEDKMDPALARVIWMRNLLVYLFCAAKCWGNSTSKIAELVGYNIKKYIKQIAWKVMEFLDVVQEIE